MSQNKSNKYRISLIIAFFSLFLTTTILMFITPISVKSTYGLTQMTSDGETIAFNVFEPMNRESQLKKAIIIGHGVIVNKEFLKGYAIELAASGFVAVPFDFRGHGQSSGDLKREGLIEDVKAIKAYLAARGDIDMNNLGIIGYSMGGGPANDIIKDDVSFKCFIGIGTSLPINESEAVKSDSGRHLNILMILAKFDEAFDLPSLKQGMAIRLGTTSSSVNVNTLYGSFTDYNASKIFYDDNSDHLTTAWDEDFIREARDWVKSTFPAVIPADENFYVNSRGMFFLIQLISGLGFFFLIIEPLSKKAISKKDEDVFRIEIPNETIKSLSKKTLIYSLIFWIPGVFMMIPVLLFLPLTLGGAMLAIMFGQAFAIMILLMRIGKKANIPLGKMLKGVMSGGKEKLLREIVLGILLAFILYLVLYSSIGLNYMGIAPSIYRIPWMIPYFAISIIMFILSQLLFNMIIQPKFGTELKDQLRAGTLNFGLMMAYICTLILIPCIIMGNFFLAMVIPIMAGILGLSSFSSVFLYQKTQSIIPGAIVNTFYVICFATTLSPFMNAMNMLSMFL